MKIVAFAGLAGSGKTTAADLFAKHAFSEGYSPRMDHFAKPLKDAAEALGASKMAQPALYRRFCQYVGKNFRDPDFVPGVTGLDYWCDQMWERLKKHQSDEVRDAENAKGHCRWFERVIIIDDVRYINEIELLGMWGATIVFVDGHSRLGLGTSWDELPEWRTDPSERVAWDYTMGRLADSTFDYAITNNSTFDFLDQIVAAMTPHWLGDIAEEVAASE